MAIYDHRSFRQGEEWWVAEVHMASGAGVAGGGPDAPAPEELKTTHDRVFFTCISDDKLPSRTAEIPSDWLNHIDHESVLRLLESAEELEGRFEMSPYNAPDARNYDEDDMIEDRDGLTWATRRTEVLRVVNEELTTLPALELICLDDSAMRDEIAFDSEVTLSDYLTAYGDEGIRELIAAVTEDFREYDSARGR